MQTAGFRYGWRRQDRIEVEVDGEA